MPKRPPSFISTCVLGSGVLLAFSAHLAPAEATRPLIRPATAIKNLKLSMPMPFEKGENKSFLGMDLEDAAVRKAALTRASEYIDFRSGRFSNDRKEKFLEKCETYEASAAGKIEPDPYCKVELERRNRTRVSRSSSERRETRRSIVADLREQRWEALSSYAYTDVVYSVRELETSGQLRETSQKIVGQSKCVPSTVAASLGHKLEEDFPEEAAVDLTTKLYEKASTCGNDLAAAQASFRLALIHIWKKNCEPVQGLMAKVESIAEAQPYYPRAKYWRFHCAGALKDEEGQKNAREALLKDHPMSFQALAIGGQDDAALAQIIQPSAPQIAIRSLIRPELNPTIRAAEALIRNDAPALAAEILDKNVAALAGLEPETRMYVALLLNRVNFALAKFKILSGLFADKPQMVSQETLRLYFPLWFFDEVKSRSEHVDPLLILSLIRQESAFNKEAHSSAGARGLMQVMPATARWVAKVKKANKLFDPQTNIQVGTKYFLKRLEQFGGDVEKTLAAYNAGANRVEQWERRYPTDNKMLFLDFIPFRETRDYVSSILRNYYWYVKLYSEQTVAGPEAKKMNVPGAKVLAIMNADAGTAAGVK